MIKKLLIISMTISLVAFTSASARETAKDTGGRDRTVGQSSPQADTWGTVNENESTQQHHSVGHALLMYVPNRIFDVFDILRLRLRVGPGISAGVRVTKGIEAQIGAYRALWVGIHGPRTVPVIPWPVGLEGRQGFKILLGDVDETTHSPAYQFDEIGVDAQVVVVGFSFGFSVAEVLDLVTGLLFIDFCGDDL